MLNLLLYIWVNMSSVVGTSFFFTLNLKISCWLFVFVTVNVASDWNRIFVKQIVDMSVLGIVIVFSFIVTIKSLVVTFIMFPVFVIIFSDNGSVSVNVSTCFSICVLFLINTMVHLIRTYLIYCKVIL